MKPLIPQIVYTPTCVDKILFTPKGDARSIIYETKESVVVNKPQGVLENLFNWQSVKEQSLFCFTEEELRKAFEFIFDKGTSNGIDIVSGGKAKQLYRDAASFVKEFLP